MASRDTRNAIISLFILAAGIKIIQVVAGNYIPDAQGGLNETVAGLNELSNVLIIGLVIFAIILIPVFAYQKHAEK